MTSPDDAEQRRRAAAHTRFLHAKAEGRTERMTVEEFIERTGLPENIKRDLRAIPETRPARSAVS
jgi:hypothetical protein